MSKKKANIAGGGESGWISAYAGMITLLFTFFLLLYSTSTIDAEKFNMMAADFRNKAGNDHQVIITGIAEGYKPQAGPEQGVDETVDMVSVARAIANAAASAGHEDSIQVLVGEGYIFIRFMDDMLFEQNSARLKSSDLELLNLVGYGIKSIQGGVGMISIIGHTAAVDYEGYPDSDRELSSGRANEVLRHFEDSIGVESAKLLAMGLGSQRPIASNNTEEGRAKNSRLEILVNSEDILGSQLNNVYRKLAG